jgi:mRNA-degrading endonuclease RelE of RelBE toxin-antitoxin system
LSKSAERLYSFLETPIFMRQIEQRASMKVLFAIEDDLLKNPERGDVIQGTHGARKARIGDPDFGRGKRGSYRYIYAYFPGYHHIVLLYLFAKNDTADLSAQVKKQLAQLMSQLKEAIK